MCCWLVFHNAQAERQKLKYKSRRFVGCYHYLYYLIGCQPQSGGGIRASQCVAILGRLELISLGRMCA